jgi:nickel-dependent lactate racemase
LKKRVDLAYGRNGLAIEVPASAQVVLPRHVDGVADEAAAIAAALAAPTGSPPLAELAAGKRRVVVTHSDITRATPNDRILPVLLRALEAAGVTRDDITLINALGTHRPQTDAELRQMLGSGIVDRYRCRQHDAWDDAELVAAGITGRGNAIRLNRTVMEADLVIFTGFIEPHFFAGFSGGPKGALPALAGHESVLTNHGYAMIGDPGATWGITDGNPIWEEMREAALLVEPLFLLNVTLNSGGEISGVFAGDVIEAHRRGCAFVRESAMVAVDEPFDAVVTTNSGYPLDQNLYQTVKGMQAAKGIVRSGGAIIMAAGCEDGLPDHGRYAELLAEAGSPEAILELLQRPGFSEQDQWQVQIQALIQQHADVYVYSDGLSDAQIHSALLRPTRNIETTLAELAPERLCVLPEGPLTIAYLDRA